MNENKRIDNLRIKIVKCVGSKAQHEKCVGTRQKHTMGIIFNIQNSRIHGQNRPVANLPVVDFRSEPREKFHHQGHWKRNFRFFFPYFAFLPFSRKVWTPFFHQPDRVAPNASEVSASDWRYKTRVKKKIRYFFTSAVTAFLRARNPSITL